MLRTTVEHASCLMKCLRLAPEICHQQTRSTCIMRRVHTPLVRKKGITQKLKQWEYEYILEDHLASKPWGDMEVILAYDVEGIGVKGDLVMVNKSLARNKLLPSGLAVYASPENIAYYEELQKSMPERTRQSLWAQKTVRALQTMNLRVPMNPHHSWTLNKTHLRVAFRAAGVELLEDCLTLPQEPISQPGEYKIKVLVNRIEEVTVNAIVYDYYDVAKDHLNAPQFPPVFGKSKVKLQIPTQLPEN